MERILMEEKHFEEKLDHPTLILRTLCIIVGKTVVNKLSTDNRLENN